MYREVNQREQQMTSPRARFAQLRRDILSYGLAEGISNLTGLLLLPALARRFSPNEYGTLDIAVLVIVLVSTVARLALPQAVVRYHAERKRNGDLEQFLSSLLVAVSVIGLALVLTAIFAADAVSRWLFADAELGVLIRLGVGSGVVTALSSVPSAALRMDRRVGHFNTGMLSYSSVYVGLALYLVFGTSMGIAGVLVASTSAAGLQLVLTVWWIRGSLTPRLSWATLKRSLRYSLPILPGDAVTWTDRQVDRLLLLTFVGLAEVGVFGAAMRLASPLRLLGLTFRLAWVPHAMAMMNSPVPERTAFYQATLKYYAAAFAVLALTLTALAPEIFAVVLPSEYQQGYIVLPWILGATALYYSGEITTLGVMIAERTHLASVAALASAVVNAVLALALIPAFGISGAAIGGFVGALVRTGMLWNFGARVSDVHFEARPLLLILTSYIIGASLLLWISESGHTVAMSLGFRALVLTATTVVVASRVLDKPLLQAIRAALGTVTSRHDTE